MSRGAAWMRRRVVWVVAGAVAGSLLGGVADATIPGGDGVIHGCYALGGQKPGLLRVVDPTAGGACKATEGAVQWSQTGPQGPQGAQGPQGPAGQDFHYHDIHVIYGDGTPAANGAALVAAVNGAAGPLLVKLEPGTYDIGTTTLTLNNDVAVEGSGEYVTTIRSEADTAVALAASATSEIRELTIASTSSSGAFTAVNVAAANANLTMRDVEVLVVAPGNAFGVVASGAQATLVNVNVYVQSNAVNGFAEGVLAQPGGSVWIWGGQVDAVETASGATAMGVNVFGSAYLYGGAWLDANGPNSYGVIAQSGVAQINSSFVQAVHGVAAASGAVLDAGASGITGTPTGTGTFHCVADYNGVYAPLSSTCS